MVFFLKKYSDFGGGKKYNLIQFLSYNLMLNSGEKKFALCATKKINISTLVDETKNQSPPFKLNGRSLISLGIWFNCSERLLNHIAFLSFNYELTW
jgi:hypothetical protein